MIISIYLAVCVHCLCGCMVLSLGGAPVRRSSSGRVRAGAGRPLLSWWPEAQRRAKLDAVRRIDVESKTELLSGFLTFRMHC